MAPKTTPAASKKKATRPRAAKKHYIRNLYNTPVVLRLGGKEGRRIELKPRGMRGDISLVKKEELEEEVFIVNNNVLYELITEAQAKEIISKQTTNMQAVHPAVAALRNEKDQPMEGGVVMEKEFNEQGITVARLQDGNVVIDKRMGIERVSAPGSVEDPIPDQRPAPRSSEEQALQKSDEVAREAKKKGLEGPQAGLAGFTVQE